MRCANCKSKIFFQGDSEELFPGSDLVFCYACRKKVTPFLEERGGFASHADHLATRARELEELGVTPLGMNALSAYCAYLDRISGSSRTQEVAAPPTQTGKPPSVPTLAQVVPAKEVVGKIEDNRRQIEALSQEVGGLRNRLRLAIWAACAGGAASIGSFIAILTLLLGA